MKFFLLDGVGAGFVFGAMIVFMIITIVLEAVTMLLMKYNKAGKAFLDSFLINLVSLGAGYIILFFNRGFPVPRTESSLANLLILFAVTVAVEFGILFLLNRKPALRKTLITAVVINVVSYLLYFLVSVFFIDGI